MLQKRNYDSERYKMRCFVLYGKGGSIIKSKTFVEDCRVDIRMCCYIRG